MKVVWQRNWIGLELRVMGNQQDSGDPDKLPGRTQEHHDRESDSTDRFSDTCGDARNPNLLNLKFRP